MLERYLGGELSEPEAELVEQHVEECLDCARKLGEDSRLERVLAEVQHASQEETRIVPELEHLQRKARLDEDLLVGKVIGDFEARRLIGSGGMGAVYQAEQLSLKRQVALKVLHTPFGQATAGAVRFSREAQAAARLHHTNIVSVFAQGQSDGFRYYAMEMIDGSGLEQVVRELRRQREEDQAGAAGRPQARRLPKPAWARPRCKGRSNFDMRRWLLELDRIDVRKRLDVVARLIADVADALDYAHGQGVIHRDVKPSNLILSVEGRLSLTDFGLARVRENPDMTIAGEFLGSPLYMSPEQVAAGRVPIDHRTDIYSLGATLYELLTLQPPYTGENREQIIGQIREGKVPRPRMIDRRIPRDLETVCLKAMGREPAHRYETAGEMAEDLRRFVRRFTIRAKRASLVTVAARFIQRHSLETLVISAVLTVILTAGLTIRHYRSMNDFANEQLEAADIVTGELWRRWDAVRIQRAMLRGYLAAASGRFSEATEAFSRAVELVRRDPEGYRSRDPSIPFSRGLSSWLGELIGHRAGRTHFHEDFRAALELRPQSQLLQLLAEIPSPAAVSRAPDEQLAPLIEKIRRLDEESIEELTHGNSGMVHIVLAWIALAGEDLDLALKLCDEALEVQSTLVIGYAVRSIVLLARHDPQAFEEARIALRLASPRKLTDQANTALGFLVRSGLMFLLGQRSEAIHQRQLGRLLLNERRKQRQEPDAPATPEEIRPREEVGPGGQFGPYPRQGRVTTRRAEKR